ncbi:SDR family oxidoreductase [Halobacteriovorax marinus]|uniref:SDR family oxidoreductase n=1 Tax=Halobacteriovorax marinus TaxID=97084 RepID=UPI003A9247B9
MENVTTLVPKREKTILIFGLSSFVGSNLAEFFKKDFRVVGTYNKNPIFIPGVLALPCDVLNKEEVQLALYAFKPDITIYAVGLSSVMECSRNPDLADALNASGLFNVVEYCQRYKSQVCYLSSGFVFAGEDKQYIEMDIPDPNTVYGKTQASAEFYIQKSSLNYIIFRSCKLYGRGHIENRKTFFETIQKDFMDRKNISCDDNVKTGYLDVYYLAMVLKICFEKGVKNRLFQISSNDTASFNEFVKDYCEIFSESSGLVQKGRWPFPFVASAATLPSGDKINFDLDISNIEGFLNINMPTVKESLEFTFKRFMGKAKTARGGSSGGEDVTFI